MQHQSLEKLLGNTIFQVAASGAGSDQSLQLCYFFSHPQRQTGQHRKGLATPCPALHKAGPHKEEEEQSPMYELRPHSITRDGGQWPGRGSGQAGAAPPVDAPLGVNLQDGGVLGVIVLHLRVGKLSTVDVDNNGGAAGALPGGCQTPDLPGIPPGGQ